MSAFLYPGLRVRIEQMEGPHAPRPLPLESGFSGLSGQSYPVLGLYCPSESGEAWFILANAASEIWFISNRHLRVVGD